MPVSSFDQNFASIGVRNFFRIKYWACDNQEDGGNRGIKREFAKEKADSQISKGMPMHENARNLGHSKGAQLELL